MKRYTYSQLDDDAKHRALELLAPWEFAGEDWREIANALQIFWDELGMADGQVAGPDGFENPFVVRFDSGYYDDTPFVLAHHLFEDDYDDSSFASDVGVQVDDLDHRTVAMWFQQQVELIARDGKAALAELDAVMDQALDDDFTVEGWPGEPGWGSIAHMARTMKLLLEVQMMRWLVRIYNVDVDRPLDELPDHAVWSEWPQFAFAGEWIRGNLLANWLRSELPTLEKRHTGLCWYESLLDVVEKFIAEPTYRAKNGRLYGRTVEDLFEALTDKANEMWRAEEEWRYSDEYLDEMCEANDLWFDEDGRLIREAA